MLLRALFLSCVTFILASCSFLVTFAASSADESNQRLTGAFAAGAPEQSAIFYVGAAADGSASDIDNDCTLETKPCASLRHALSQNISASIDTVEVQLSAGEHKVFTSRLPLLRFSQLLSNRSGVGLQYIVRKNPLDTDAVARISFETDAPVISFFGPFFFQLDVPGAALRFQDLHLQNLPQVFVSVKNYNVSSTDMQTLEFENTHVVNASTTFLHVLSSWANVSIVDCTFEQLATDAFYFTDFVQESVTFMPVNYYVLVQNSTVSASEATVFQFMLEYSATDTKTVSLRMINSTFQDCFDIRPQMDQIFRASASILSVRTRIAVFSLETKGCSFMRNNFAGAEGGTLAFRSVAGQITWIDETSQFVANNCTNYNGGAVYVSTTGGNFRASLDGTIFERNSALSGAALFVDSRSKSLNAIIINHATFRNNIGVKTGAISTSSVIGSTFMLDIFGSLFEGNEARDSGATFEPVSRARIQYMSSGGAISAISSNAVHLINIKNSTFLRNSAYRAGGSINALGVTQLTIDSCSFSEDTSFVDGGSIYISIVKKFQLLSSTFYRSNSKQNGGALVAQNVDNFAVTGCLFDQGFASFGGALFLFDIYDTQAGVYKAHSATVTGNTFRGCSARQNGGSVHTSGKNYLMLVENIFEALDEYIQDINSISGGALYLSGSSIAYVESAGGFSPSAGTLIATNIFRGLTTLQNGGAIAVADRDVWVRIDSCQFLDLYAYDNGAAIYATNSMLSTFNNRFERCSTYGNGACIFSFCQNAVHTHTDNVFIDNTSGTGVGGVLYNSNTDLYLYRNTFIGSTATVAGGVACTASTTCYIQGGSFTNCSAAQSAGAVFCSESRCTLEGVQFDSNTAGAGGSIFFMYQQQALQSSLSNVHIRNSEASMNGGAIAFDLSFYLFLTELPMLVVSNMSITGSKARYGGTFFINGPADQIVSDIVSIDNLCSIRNTFASVAGGAYFFLLPLGSAAAFDHLASIVHEPFGSAGYGPLFASNPTKFQLSQYEFETHSGGQVWVNCSSVDQFGQLTTNYESSPREFDYHPQLSLKVQPLSKDIYVSIPREQLFTTSEFSITGIVYGENGRMLSEDSLRSSLNISISCGAASTTSLATMNIKSCLSKHGLIADVLEVPKDKTLETDKYASCIQSPCRSFSSIDYYRSTVNSLGVPILTFLGSHIFYSIFVIPFAVAQRLRGAYKFLNLRVIWLVSHALVSGAWFALTYMEIVGWKDGQKPPNQFGEPRDFRVIDNWMIVLIILVMLSVWQAYMSCLFFVEMSSLGLLRRIPWLKNNIVRDRLFNSTIVLIFTVLVSFMMSAIGAATLFAWHILLPIVLCLTSLVQLASGALYFARLLQTRPWLKEKDTSDYRYSIVDEEDDDDDEDSDVRPSKTKKWLRRLRKLAALRRKLAWNRIVPLRARIALKCFMQVFGSLYLVLNCFIVDVTVLVPFSAQVQCQMQLLSLGLFLGSMFRTLTPFVVITMVPIPQSENVSQSMSSSSGQSVTPWSSLDPSNLKPEAIYELIPRHLRIEPEDLHFGDTIGSGAQGIVFKGEYQQVPVAIKVIQTSRFGTTTDLASFFSELMALSQSHHPHILRLLGVSFDPQKSRLSIVTEYCAHGSLANVLDKCRVAAARQKQGTAGEVSADFRPLTFADKLRILYQICAALAYLHGRGLVHRDVKAENVLLTESFEAKLADLGTAKYITQDTAMTMAVGTSSYIAPEVLKAGMSAEYELASTQDDSSNSSPMLSRDSANMSNGSLSNSKKGQSKKKKRGAYGQKCDCYSMGILMYVLLTESTRPYGLRSEADILLQVVRRDSNFRPPVDNEPSGKIQSAIEYNARWYIDLMQQLWSYHPDDRPSMEHVVRILRQKMK